MDEMRTPDTSSDDATLAAAESIAAKATPPPWTACVGVGTLFGVRADPPAGSVQICATGSTHRARDDSDFIAASRELVPALVAIARRLQVENAELTRHLNNALYSAASYEGRFDKAEAEVRELRAEVIRLQAIVYGNGNAQPAEAEVRDAALLNRNHERTDSAG